MSFNQSRFEKSEGQSRKPGGSDSSAYQMSFLGGEGKGGGGGTAPPPSPSISSSSSLSTNKSITKSINGLGGHSRVGPISSNSERNAAITAKNVAQNGTHLQSHSHGVSDALVSVSARPMDSSMPGSSRSVPKVPSHQSTSAASDSTVLAAPSKGDVSRTFPLQFGTISPGLMNGMQIPARTSSAPPNLDEQKRDQAHHNSFRAVPTLPIPSAPKQQQQVKKDVTSMNQSNAASSQPPLWTKRDINVPTPAAPASTAQKSSVLPMTGVSMPMPFQQPPVPMQFGGPSPQIQSQGITAPPLQMPMPLPVGNSAQVQHPVFVPTLQSQPLLPEGSCPGRGGNQGVLRNPRRQSSGQYSGVILSGPVQSLAPSAGMPRADADIQKGLMPSPQTPLRVMHKADKKYVVGKVSDEEDAKQRQLKAILNKLTPQNFEKHFAQVKAVNIDSVGTLAGVVLQIFDKALMKPTFCEMYADLCCHLADELPHFSEDNEKITFRRLLLNMCQGEFERGEREQADANRADEDGEVQQSEEEREEKKLKARRRMLGNIRLIGELYKKKMLTERIMHECIKKLLGQYENPDEEDVEALCELMSTIGERIDHPKAREHMDAYFDMMQKLSENQKLSSRVRFMLRDAIDLRKNKWQQKKVEERSNLIDCTWSPV